MPYRVKEDGKLYDIECQSQGYKKQGNKYSSEEEYFGEQYAGMLYDALSNKLGNEYDDDGNHLISRKQWEDLSTWYAQDPALWGDDGYDDRYKYTKITHTEDHSEEGEPFRIESYTKYEYDSSKWNELDSNGMNFRDQPDPKNDEWLYETLEFQYEAYEIEEDQPIKQINTTKAPFQFQERAFSISAMGSRPKNQCFSGFISSKLFNIKQIVTIVTKCNLSVTAINVDIWGFRPIGYKVTRFRYFLYIYTPPHIYILLTFFQFCFFRGGSPFRTNRILL